MRDSIPRDFPQADVRLRLALGAELPHDVELYEFPALLLDRIPKLRDYRFLVAEDQIVIVDPRESLHRTGYRQSLNFASARIAARSPRSWHLRTLTPFSIRPPKVSSCGQSSLRPVWFALLPLAASTPKLALRLPLKARHAVRHRPRLR